MLTLAKGWWDAPTQKLGLSWAEDWLDGITSIPNLSKDDPNLGIVFWTTRDATVIPAGIALLKDGQFSFAYHPEYAANPDTPDIAYKLPKRTEPYGNEAWFWFDNLVSEGWLAMAQSVALGDLPRATLDTSHGKPIDRSIIEERDTPETRYRRLLHFGKSCHGAVSLLPASGDIEMLEHEHQDMRAAIGSGGIIGGVQRKLLVRQSTKGHYDPTDAFTSSTHIVKLDDYRKVGIIENELVHTAFTRFLLRDDEVVEVGLAEVQFTDGSREKSLSIRRFDRTPDGGRIHFEEATQLLGLHAVSKYNGTYRQLADLTRKLVGEDGVKVLFKRVIAQFVLGNADGHLKNIAFWKDEDGNWQLAPNYDLVNTVAYRIPGSSMDELPLCYSDQRAEAMAHRRIHDMLPKNIFLLGRAFGLNIHEVREAIMGEDGIARRLPMHYTATKQEVGQATTLRKGVVAGFERDLHGRAHRMFGKSQHRHHGPTKGGRRTDTIETVFGNQFERYYRHLASKQQGHGRGR